MRNLATLTMTLFSLQFLIVSISAQTGPKPEIVVQMGHAFWIYSVVSSPDGKKLASASYDATVKSGGVDTGQELRTLGRTFRVRQVSRILSKRENHRFGKLGQNGEVMECSDRADTPYTHRTSTL